MSRAVPVPQGSGEGEFTTRPLPRHPRTLKWPK